MSEHGSNISQLELCIREDVCFLATTGDLTLKSQTITGLSDVIPWQQHWFTLAA